MTILKRLQHFREAQKAERDLNRLGARELADIGITRGDIANAVRGRR